MKWGHMHGEMSKEMMMKKMFMKKMMMKEIMEYLSEEDKKKLAAMKLDMKISMAEKKLELMDEKKKIMAAKLDMKASMAEQKIELLKAIRDMLKEKM